ncbi:unnamed protein product [Auanema sp. JU1783]|nr:unnamed protein product [Auanema sp. JU1783]
MPAEADRLRRSKRNKFFLHVSPHGTTDRRRTQPASNSSPVREEPQSRAQSASPMRASSSTPIDDESKRPRRANRSSNFYYEDDSEEEDDSRVCGMYGVHKCNKCPSRFETRPGLANHMRLHGGLNRKNTCKDCDFSCGSLKAIRNHIKCHRRLDKEATPTHSDTRSEDSNNSPPKLTPEVHKDNVEMSDTSPPELKVPENLIMESNAKKSDKPVAKVNKDTPPKISKLINKIIECEHCPFKSRNQCRMKIHTEGHRKMTGFRCHRCSMTVSNCGLLKLHITRVHQEHSDFQWPPKYFVDGVEQANGPVDVPKASAEKLEDKRKRRARLFPRDGKRKDTKLYCPVGDCTYYCYTGNQMATHKYCHHPQKTSLKKYHCVTCGMGFDHRGKLVYHRLRAHPRRKLHPRVKSMLFEEARGRHFLKGIYNNSRAQASQDIAALEETATSASVDPVSTITPSPVPEPMDAIQLMNVQSSIETVVNGGNEPATPISTIIKPTPLVAVSQTDQSVASATNTIVQMSNPMFNTPQAVISASLSSLAQGSPQISVSTIATPQLGSNGHIGLPINQANAQSLLAHPGMSMFHLQGSLQGHMIPPMPSLPNGLHLAQTGAMMMSGANSAMSQMHPNTLQNSLAAPGAQFLMAQGSPQLAHSQLMHHPSMMQQISQSQPRFVNIPTFLKGVSCEVIEVAELPRILDQAFKCNLCPYSTTARTKLEKHVARHDAPSDMKCPICTYQCRGESFMQQHFRTHVALIQRITRLTINNPNGDMAASIMLPYMPRYHPVVQELTAAAAIAVAGSLGQFNANMPQNIYQVPHGFPSPISGPSVSSAPATVGAAATAAVAAARLIRNDRTTSQGNRNKRERTFVPVVLPDGTRLRRCLECPYVSKHSCDISTHYQMHLSAPQKFRCSQCTYSTKRSVCLRAHFEQHRAQNASESTARPLTLKINGVLVGMRSGTGKLRIYSCRLCPFASRTISALWRHSRNHIFVRSPAYRCPSCDYFGSKEVLEQHVLLHSSEVHPILLRSSQTPPSPAKRENGEVVTPISNKNLTKTKKSYSRPSTEPSSKVPTPKSATPPPPNLSPAPILTKIEGEVAIKAEEIKQELEGNKAPTLTTSTSSRNLKNAESVNMKFDDPLSIDILEDMANVHPLLERLRKEEKCQETGQCPDCPYTDTDELLMKIHRDMHSQPPRAHQCELCSFSCSTPQCLHRHISLHLPPLSPSSLAALKQKNATRRRFQPPETIPNGVAAYSCYKCSFKTIHNDKLTEHVYQHVEDYRRRLNTTTKREQLNEESKKIKTLRRNARKSDKFYSCDLCSFRCETITAFSRHNEMHSLNGLYRCSMCTYSAFTKSITTFHEMNHHTDHSLTNLQKSALLAPNAIQMKVEDPTLDLHELAGQIFSCVRCKNFSCLESRELELHWLENHNDSQEDKDRAMFMSFSLFRANGIATIA